MMITVPATSNKRKWNCPYAGFSFTWDNEAKLVCFNGALLVFDVVEEAGASISTGQPAGPSPGFSSRGAKTRRGHNIFKIQ